MTYDIIKKLQILVNNTSDGEVSSNIAKVILQNIYLDLDSMNIKDLADKAYTSVSTVSRFAKSLGFDSFNELRRTCLESKRMSRDVIQDSLDNMEFDNINDREILVSFTESIAEDLKSFARNIDLNEVDKVVELIHKHEKIDFYGIHLTGYFLEHLQYLFMNMGKYAQFKPQDLDQHKLSENTDEHTLCVIFSVDGNFIRGNSAVFYNARERGAKIILVTQNPALKIAPKCDKVLYLGDYKSPKNGQYKLHLFMEIIVNRYYLKYSDEFRI